MNAVNIIDIFTVLVFTKMHFNGTHVPYKLGKYEFDINVKSIIIPPCIIVTFFETDEFTQQSKIVTYKSSKTDLDINKSVRFILIQACTHPCYQTKNNLIQ